MNFVTRNNCIIVEKLEGAKSETESLMEKTKVFIPTKEKKSKRDVHDRFAIMKIVKTSDPDLFPENSVAVLQSHLVEEVNLFYQEQEIQFLIAPTSAVVAISAEEAS